MKPQRRVPALISVVALITIMAAGVAGYGYSAPASGPNTLASPESFSGIADPLERSAAYFTELGKVLTNPRCTNCHPAGDRPHQGDASRLHQPPVLRGTDGFGLETMRCPICHQSANFDPGRVPGHAAWHLAPREMAWEGKPFLKSAYRSKIPRATAIGLCTIYSAYRHRHACWLGMGSWVRQNPGARDADGSWRTRQGLGGFRRSLSLERRRGKTPVFRCVRRDHKQP
jgi:hypothetical protein